jgi:hypothetical protein
MSVVWTTALADAVRAVPMNERLGWDIDDAEWQAEWSVGRDNWEGRRRTLERSGWWRWVARAEQGLAWVRAGLLRNQIEDRRGTTRRIQE